MALFAAMTPIEMAVFEDEFLTDLQTEQFSQIGVLLYANADIHPADIIAKMEQIKNNTYFADKLIVIDDIYAEIDDDDENKRIFSFWMTKNDGFINHTEKQFAMNLCKMIEGVDDVECCLLSSIYG
jgi:hypothetical protein